MSGIDDTAWVSGAGEEIAARVEAAAGRRAASVVALGGGCVAEVYRVRMAEPPDLVVKVDRGRAPKMHVEGLMLRALRERSGLPVPAVVSAEPVFLVMAFVEHDGRRDAAGERDFGVRLAAMHGRPAERYGFECDTLIGPLEQPNPWSDDWPGFFAEHRLVRMAEAAEGVRALPAGTLERCLRLAARIGEVIAEPQGPSLVHGDLWAGNMLWDGGGIAAVIDPGAHYGDAEVELSFIDLMGGLSGAFWEGYESVRPIREGFWDVRRHVYNLYPLLVHARLFGGGYGASVARSLGRVGF